MQVPVYSLKYSSTLHRTLDKRCKNVIPFSTKSFTNTLAPLPFAPTMLAQSYIGESLLKISGFWVGLVLPLSTIET